MESIALWVAALISIGLSIWHIWGLRRDLATIWMAIAVLINAIRLYIFGG